MLIQNSGFGKPHDVRLRTELVARGEGKVIPRSGEIVGFFPKSVDFSLCLVLEGQSQGRNENLRDRT